MGTPGESDKNSNPPEIWICSVSVLLGIISKSILRFLNKIVFIRFDPLFLNKICTFLHKDKYFNAFSIMAKKCKTIIYFAGFVQSDPLVVT